MSKILKALVSMVLIVFIWFLPPSMALATIEQFAQPVSISPIAKLSMNFPLTSYETFAFFLRWFFREREREEENEEFPADTESQGRRGPCNQVSQEFVAFVPPLKQPSQLEEDELPSIDVTSSIEFTIQSAPELWFYLPEHRETAHNAELMLQDKLNQDVIDTPISIPLPESSGAFSISLKAAGIELEVNKPYHWYVSIICNAERPSQNPSVDAWIQRIPQAPELVTQLASMTSPQDRVQVYIEQQSIWYDGLSLLAALRCRSPEDETLHEAWTTLLADIGISEEVANASILYPCADFP